MGVRAHGVEQAAERVLIERSALPISQLLQLHTVGKVSRGEDLHAGASAFESAEGGQEVAYRDVGSGGYVRGDYLLESFKRVPVWRGGVAGRPLGPTGIASFEDAFLDSEGGMRVEDGVAKDELR